LVYEGVPIFRRWPLPFLEHCNHAAVQGRGLVHVLGKLEGGICDCQRGKLKMGDVLTDFRTRIALGFVGRCRRSMMQFIEQLPATS
jgi:hypothetical protein